LEYKSFSQCENGLTYPLAKSLLHSIKSYTVKQVVPLELSTIWIIEVRMKIINNIKQQFLRQWKKWGYPVPK